MKVIMKCVNIKLWDIRGCFHYILNAPRRHARGASLHFMCLGINYNINGIKTDQYHCLYNKEIEYCFLEFNKNNIFKKYNQHSHSILVIPSYVSPKCRTI